MTAVVVAVKAKHESTTNFVDIDVNNTAEANLTNQFRINSIPTSVFFDKTGKPAYQYVGVIKEEKLVEYLKKLER